MTEKYQIETFNQSHWKEIKIEEKVKRRKIPIKEKANWDQTQNSLSTASLKSKDNFLGRNKYGPGIKVAMDILVEKWSNVFFSFQLLVE